MKKVFFIILLLCLALPVFAGFKSPTTPNQPLIVESDKYFYGSDWGVVDIDLNLINPNSVDYDLYLNITDLYDYGVRVSRFKDNGKDTVIDAGKLKTKDKLKIKKNSVLRIQISLNYDPQIIGFGKKFDVQLVDGLGLMVADLDPFLSGYSYRRQLTITNNSIVTAPDTNTTVKLILGNNLGAKAQADCDDVRVTSGETTELDRNSFGNCQTDANIFFPLKFSIAGSGSDNNYYVYYGNGTASSPSANEQVLPAPDSKGKVYCPFDNTLDNLSGGTDCTNSGTIYTSTSVAGEGAVTNDNQGDIINTKFSPSGESALTVEFWVKFVNTTKQRFAGARTGAPIDMLEFVIEDDGTLRTIVYNDGGVLYDLTSTTIPAVGGFVHFAFTCGNTGAKMWYNGTPISRSADTTCPNLTGGTELYLGNSNGTAGEEAKANTIFDEFRVSTTQKTNFPNLDINSKAEQPTVSLGAEQQATAITWHNFWIRPYSNPANVLDLNIRTDMNFYLDFNLTLNNFNVNDINTFYKVSYGSADSNCFIGIRNTRLCDWKKEIWTFTKIGGGGDVYTMRSASEDDHAYKPSSYNLDPDNYETKGGVITLNSGNTWANTLITGARYDQAVGDSNMFFNVSWSGNFTGGINRNLILYDCNSTTTTPSTNAGCVSRIYTNTTAKDPDTYYSFLYESNDSNSFSGMKLNPDGNHWLYFNCPNCTPTQYWTLDYIAQNSNVDRTRNWTSTTGINNLATYTNTIDTHIHWQSLLKDSNFYYYFGVKDGTTDYNSPIQSEDVDNVNLSPLIELITSPIGNQVYSNDVNFTLKVGDPNSDAIVCDANIRNAKTGVDYNIFTNWTPVNNLCTIQKSTLLIPDGNYYLMALVRETSTTELYSSSRQMDQNFFIDNNAPFVVLNSPNGGASYTQPTSINIDFNLVDYYSPLLIDINYSDSNIEGTGTVIVQSLSTNSNSVLCTSSIFETTQNCVYSWTVAGISDGNYRILIKVRDALYRGFDASDNNFELKEPVSVPSTPPRYINPEYDQRDSNIYYSLKQDYAKTDTEKTNEILINMQNNIFLLFGIIIIIGVVLFIWIKK